MAERRLGIILSGVTGRIGVNQHLGRALVPLRDMPMALSNGDRLVIDPILVGRNAAKLEQVASRFGIARWTTDLDAALSDPDDALFFDSATTHLRSTTCGARSRPASTCSATSRSRPLTPKHWSSPPWHGAAD